MSIPVKTFQTCDINEIKKGEFFLLAKEWYLAVDYVGNHGGKISAIRVATTDHSALGILPDMPKEYSVLRVAPPYSTELYSDRIPSVPGTYSLRSLFIAQHPMIVAKLEHVEMLFTTSGTRLPSISAIHQVPTVPHWELWVVRQDGTKVGDEPLFTVG